MLGEQQWRQWCWFVLAEQQWRQWCQLVLAEQQWKQWCWLVFAEQQWRQGCWFAVAEQQWRQWCWLVAIEQQWRQWCWFMVAEQRALLLLVEIQCAAVEQNETKSQSPLTLIGKGRVYGICIVGNVRKTAEGCYCSEGFEQRYCRLISK